MDREEFWRNVFVGVVAIASWELGKYLVDKQEQRKSKHDRRTKK